MSEHTFDDQSGAPARNLQRALERRNLPSAWAAATELQVVSLADALALCLVVRDCEPGSSRGSRFAGTPASALRTRGVDLESGRLVLDLLTALNGREARAAARALRELLGSYDRSLVEPLRRWEADHVADGGGGAARA